MRAAAYAIPIFFMRILNLDLGFGGRARRGDLEPGIAESVGRGTGRGTFPGDGSRDTSWVARVGRPSNAVVAGGAASVRDNAWRDLIVAHVRGPNSRLRCEIAATGRPGAWPGRLHRQRRQTGVQAGRKGHALSLCQALGDEYIQSGRNVL